MQSKSRISSLNEKFGSVRNMISAFEEKKKQEDEHRETDHVIKLKPETLDIQKLHDSPSKNVVIEGDSNGIMGVHYVAPKEALEEVDTILEENKQDVHSISGDDNDVNSKAEDQINNLIEDYQNGSTSDGNSTTRYNPFAPTTESVDSTGSLNLVDFTAKGLKETVPTTINNASSSVIVEDVKSALTVDQSSSLYLLEQESEQPKRNFTYQHLIIDRDSPETNNSKSTWKDGEMLIQKFGYNSTVNSESIQTSQKESNQDMLNNFYDNETLKTKNSIESSPSRKKSQFNWKFGDIDGLERASMQPVTVLDNLDSGQNYYPELAHTSPQRGFAQNFNNNDNNYFKQNLNINNEFNNDNNNGNSNQMRGNNDDDNFNDNHFDSLCYSENNNNAVPKYKQQMNSSISRTRSASFKDDEKGDSDDRRSRLYISKPETNPWKYACYSILVTVGILWFIYLIFNAVYTTVRPTVILSEHDVIDYFDKISNGTRDTLLEQLSNKYSKSLGNYKTEHSNLRTPKLRYSPRENDKDINVVYNSFENINLNFQNDAEIKQLMTEDSLKFMFSGMSYAPEGVIEPVCGIELRKVMLDLARLSKVTGSIKTYGTQCRQAEFILEAIDQLQLNMTLALGVWIGTDDTVNEAQMNELKRVLQLYPKTYIRSIFIGNEVLYRDDKNVTELNAYIKDTKQFLKNHNITGIPVGTSEIGSMITKELFSEADFVGANIHPFFGGIDAEFGTRWVLNYYFNELLSLKSTLGVKTPLIISEVGWPYQGGEFIRSVAGNWEYQQFLSDWLCTSPAEILNDCFFFEAFDEPWKKIWWSDNRTWETEWGFFTKDRKLKKHIYIPDCSKYGNPELMDLNYLKEVEDPYQEGTVIALD